MSPGAAALLLGAGGLLLALWLAGLLLLLRRGVPEGEAILAHTGVSVFQAVGGGGCGLVFAVLWAQALLSCAGGEAPLDLPVLLWSTPLALLGMTMFWMALVRRVWCGAAALIQRTWKGEIIVAPWEELAGAEAVFSYDDMLIPWGERQLTIDTTLPGFDEVAGYLEGRGIDLSARPPKRPSFLHKEK